MPARDGQDVSEDRWHATDLSGAASTRRHDIDARRDTLINITAILPAGSAIRRSAAILAAPRYGYAMQPPTPILRHAFAAIFPSRRMSAMLQIG